MSRYPHKNTPLKKADVNKKVFEARKPGRLGTKKSPARVTVQSEERKLELEAVFLEKNWTYEITVDPEKDENILELEFLQNKKESLVTEKTPNRNEPCVCGSGKKYKKCCGAQA